ncbi:hypothetical protein [Streptomyces sp. NPDC002172]
MPVVTDLDAVPLTPVYTIVITEDDQASVDGQSVEKLHGQDAREAALADVRERAARRGHPVRVNAKEPDGSVWPLIVDYDGAVTPLEAPHPAPPAPALPAQAPAPVYSAPVGEPSLPPPTGEPVIPAPAAPVVDWMAPLPEEFREMFEQVKGADGTGQLAAAAVAAQDLEDALDDAFGPVHPYTVNVLAVRAYLNLRMGHWAMAMALYLQAAERRHQQQAPREETLRLARQGHFCWKHLAKPSPKHPGAYDPATAIQWTAEVLRVLRTVGAEEVIVVTTEKWAAELPSAAAS